MRKGLLFPGLLHFLISFLLKTCHAQKFGFKIPIRVLLSSKLFRQPLFLLFPPLPILHLFKRRLVRNGWCYWGWFGVKLLVSEIGCVCVGLAVRILLFCIHPMTLLETRGSKSGEKETLKEKKKVFSPKPSPTNTPQLTWTTKVRFKERASVKAACSQ